MDYILFGIQGSGKGTQGKILAEKLGAAYFETGGELRRLSKEDSPLGHKVKEIIEAGHLVPTEVVMEIVEIFLMQSKTAASAAVFDGIPRNDEQNRLFTALLQKHGRAYQGIYFELSRKEAENRLLKRRICSQCKAVYPAFYQNPTCGKCGGPLHTRADDNAESIRTRIEIFYKETVPVIEEWKSAGKIMKIDAAPPIEEITTTLLSKIAA